MAVGNGIVDSNEELANEIVGLSMKVQDGIDAQKALTPLIKDKAQEHDLSAKLDSIRHDSALKDSNILYPADAVYVTVDGVEKTWKKHKADADEAYTERYCSDEAVTETIDKIIDARDDGTLDVRKNTVKALKKGGHGFCIKGTINAGKGGVRDTPRGHIDRLRQRVAEKRADRLADQADS
jgi:hypothetical protein